MGRTLACVLLGMCAMLPRAYCDDCDGSFYAWAGGGEEACLQLVESLYDKNWSIDRSVGIEGGTVLLSSVVRIHTEGHSVCIEPVASAAGSSASETAEDAIIAILGYDMFKSCMDDCVAGKGSCKEEDVNKGATCGESCGESYKCATMPWPQTSRFGRYSQAFSFEDVDLYLAHNTTAERAPPKVVVSARHNLTPWQAGIGAAVTALVVLLMLVLIRFSGVDFLTDRLQAVVKWTYFRCCATELQSNHTVLRIPP